MEVDLLGLNLAILHINLSKFMLIPCPSLLRKNLHGYSKQHNVENRTPIATCTHLISAKNDGDGLAHTNNISVPVGHVLVCHACCHVEHNDGAVSLDVVSCSSQRSATTFTCMESEHDQRANFCRHKNGRNINVCLGVPRNIRKVFDFKGSRVGSLCILREHSPSRRPPNFS
jgi:hypothetical protein